MLYQVRLTALFASFGHAQGLKNHALGLINDMTIIRPGTPEEEASVIEVIQNHHDDDPTTPCDLISHWDNSPPIVPP